MGEVGGAHWFAQAVDQHEASGNDGSSTSSSAEGCVLVEVEYHIHTSGLVVTQWNIDTREALPAQLPPGLHR